MPGPQLTWPRWQLRGGQAPGACGGPPLSPHHFEHTGGHTGHTWRGQPLSGPVSLWIPISEVHLPVSASFRESLGFCLSPCVTRTTQNFTKPPTLPPSHLILPSGVSQGPLPPQMERGVEWRDPRAESGSASTDWAAPRTPPLPQSPGILGDIGVPGEGGSHGDACYREP